MAIGRLIRLCGVAAMISASLLASAESARAESSVVRLAKQFGISYLQIGRASCRERVCDSV